MTLNLSSLVLLLFASAVMGSGIGYSKLYLFHLVLVLLVFVFIYYISFNRRQVTLHKPKNYFIYFLYFMFAWYSLSLFWSIEVAYTLRYLFYLLIGVSIVFLLNAYIVDRSRYLSVFKVLKVFFILAVIIALLESFTSFRLPTSPYSDYASIFGRNATNFLEFESDIQALIKSAPTSFWGNPNNLAVSMTLIFPFFLMHKNLIVKIIGIVCILLIIAMAGSRGAFLGGIFGIAVFFFLKGVRYWLPMLMLVLLSLGVVSTKIEALKQSDNTHISELAWTGNMLYSYVFEREETMNSIGYRQQLIENGLDALWTTNGLGVGGGGSQAVQERLGGVGGELTSMHNFWVEVLVDAGVLFFIFFMTWYLTLAFKLYKIYKTSRDSFYRYQSGSLFIAMMVFLVSAVSASSVIYLLPMWIMFGLSIVLTILYKKERFYENSITSRS